MVDFNVKAFYSNLARVMRGGRSVPHQIAAKTAGPGEFVGAPLGTAAQYLQSQTNWFTNRMANYGNFSRLARLGEYQEMEQMAEVHSALDIYSHEVCCKGEYGEILKIESENPKIKEALTKLFYDTLNIEFNLAPWVRSLCKYGDYFLLIDHHPDFGVINVFPMPVNEIEREEGFDDKNPTRYRYRWIARGKKVLEPWQVIHFRLLGNDNYLPYGMSVLEAGRRAWRQLIMIEDAVMVYRIVRSPERRVFYLDVGNIAPQDVNAVIEKAKNQIKRTQVIDPSSGQVDLRYNALSVEDDYFLPVRGKDSGTKIETLPGGQFVGDIEDLQYIQNKLFAALKIPKSYLGYEADAGKATLSQEDVRFARTIQHIQRVVLAELEKIAMLHLYAMGLRDEDLLNFDLSMANPSTINEIQRLELWRTRFEVASLATGQDGVLDKRFIYKHIFKLNDDEIDDIKQGRIDDQKFKIMLDSMDRQAQAKDEFKSQEMMMQLQQPDPNADPDATDDTGDTDEDPDGMNDVPAGDPNQQKAIPNEMLGGSPKNWKQITPNLQNLAYNTKKNGMDPRNALGIMRRMGTAPFGEQAAKRDHADAIFDRRVAQLGRSSRLLDQFEKMNIGSSRKKLNE